MVKHFQTSLPFTLESGNVLTGLQLAYTTYGTLNQDASNVVWVFHALTASSEAMEWWSGLIGENKLFTPNKYFIICVNMPGSSYGSINPLAINAETGNPYYLEFPLFTTRDMIRSYQLLCKEIGIEKIHIGIGGSMGGQQLLEWAVEEPNLFQNIIPIATNAQHSPWGIAFNATQRHCIEQDPSWQNNDPLSGMEGMKLAREIALLSYRSYETYQSHQSEATNEKLEQFKSESYQLYQGQKLAQRFNAYSYYFLSKSMDAHNLGRGRESVVKALQKIKAKTLVISISSDWLFPEVEQAFIAQNIGGAVYCIIDSVYGHDGFLLEFEQIELAIKKYILQKD